MNYLVFSGILALFITVASGLNCEQCTTLDKKTCRDPYTEDNSGECDDDQYCVKYKTVVWIRDSGYINGWKRPSQVVTRTCEARQGKKEGCYNKQNNGGILMKCYCGSDGCNSGSLASPVKVFVALVSLLSLLLMRFRH